MKGLMVERRRWGPCFQRETEPRVPFWLLQQLLAVSPYSLPLLPSSIFPEYFRFIQLNFSDVVLYYFSLLCTEIISVMPWVCGLIRKHKYYKKTPEFILENFLDNKLLVCWKLLYIKRTHFLILLNLKLFSHQGQWFSKGIPCPASEGTSPL